MIINNTNKYDNINIARKQSKETDSGQPIDIKDKVLLGESLTAPDFINPKLILANQINSNTTLEIKDTITKSGIKRTVTTEIEGDKKIIKTDITLQDGTSISLREKDYKELPEVKDEYGHSLKAFLESDPKTGADIVKIDKGRTMIQINTDTLLENITYHGQEKLPSDILNDNPFYKELIDGNYNGNTVLHDDTKTEQIVYPDGKTDIIETNLTYFTQNEGRNKSEEIPFLNIFKELHFSPDREAWARKTMEVFKIKSSHHGVLSSTFERKTEKDKLDGNGDIHIHVTPIEMKESYERLIKSGDGE